MPPTAVGDTVAAVCVGCVNGRGETPPTAEEMSLFGRRGRSSSPQPKTPREDASPTRGASVGGLFSGGDKASKPGKVPYTKDDIEALVKSTVFDKKEIVTLGTMYRKYTTAAVSTIPVEKMRDIPETSVFPLFQRVVQMHNDDNGGFIEFKEFVQAMSSLSPKATLQEKLNFTFRLFDMGNSGTIDPPEVFQLLRMTMGNTLTDSNLQTIVDGFLKRFPEGMDFDTFVQMVDISALGKLTLPLDEKQQKG